MKKFLLVFAALSMLLCSCAKTKQETPAPTASAQPTESAPAEVPSGETTPISPTPTTISDEGPKLSTMYIDIIKSGDYFMKAKLRGEAGISEFAVSVSAHSTAMETAAQGTLYNTVIKDGITYMIDHQNKMVITSSVEVAPSASNMAGESLSTEGISFFEKGTASFDGAELPFEAYKTPSGGTMRFYFRGTALAGIETEESGKALYYIIEEISSGHRADMHVIPEGYPLIDMAALGG